MEGIRDSLMHGMAPAPVEANATGMPNMRHRHGMFMHMSFFWGHDALILFSGWPGTHFGMYFLALIFVFVLSVLVEWLCHCRLVSDASDSLAGGLAQTAAYGVRVGLAYMVMLAVMSFNVGVFLMAVAGHALGFFLFGSRVFRKRPPACGKLENLGPMSC
ncbi:copper transporter 6-like [Diospyros lotus]|uniref:copper transporter 6-like n=1 Tax=Diospyros lotus TaxID=55363 RepID=UPI00225926A1|nr:copper transporter 6-like [Diospyros lotus]